MEHKLKEYAGGWMTERTGTGVPGFLKLAFFVILAGSIAYFFLYLEGETSHSDRGLLVREFNSVTTASDVFMYATAAMIAIFGAIVLVFALRKPHE